MKRKNCVTDARRKTKIGILTSLAIILCIALSLGYVRFAQGYLSSSYHKAGLIF